MSRAHDGPTVAVLLSRHWRDTLSNASTVAPLLRFLRLCRTHTRRCDVFVHAWSTTQPRTRSYYDSAAASSAAIKEEAAAALNVSKLTSLLSPAGVTVEQDRTSSTSAEWGRSKMRVSAIKNAFHGMRAANELALASRDRYDVHVRARPVNRTEDATLSCLAS